MWESEQSLWAERNLWPRLDVVSLSFYSRRCNFLFHLYLLYGVSEVWLSALKLNSVKLIFRDIKVVDDVLRASWD